MFTKCQNSHQRVIKCIFNPDVEVYFRKIMFLSLWLKGYKKKYVEFPFHCNTSHIELMICIILLESNIKGQKKCYIVIQVLGCSVICVLLQKTKKCFIVIQFLGCSLCRYITILPDSKSLWSSLRYVNYYILMRLV